MHTSAFALRVFRFFVAASLALVLALPISSIAGDGNDGWMSWGSWGWGKAIVGSGNIKTETRTVTDFTGIQIALPSKVTLRQGNSESVVIETDDNILPEIETVVESGNLKIRPREKNGRLKTKTLNVTVNFKSIERLSAAGAGEVRADSIKVEKLKVSVAGSGNVRIQSIEADTLNFSIAGSGDFNAGGNAKSVDASIAGSGALDIGRLQTQAIKLSIAGSGSSTVWAKESLKLSVAGSGDVRYYGDPVVSKSIAGSGSIVRVGAAP
jgi:Putative auto-transporter adhesin, head GIN domain